MAVNNARSMVESLLEGATDGMLKKPRPDTVVDTFDATADVRMPLYRPRSGYGMQPGEMYNDDINRGTVRGAR